MHKQLHERNEGIRFPNIDSLAILLFKTPCTVINMSKQVGDVRNKHTNNNQK